VPYASIRVSRWVVPPCERLEQCRAPDASGSHGGRVGISDVYPALAVHRRTANAPHRSGSIVAARRVSLECSAGWRRRRATIAQTSTRSPSPVRNESAAPNQRWCLGVRLRLGTAKYLVARMNVEMQRSVRTRTVDTPAWSRASSARSTGRLGRVEASRGSHYRDHCNRFCWSADHHPAGSGAG
jgi:hypothetical protein